MAAPYHLSYHFGPVLEILRLVLSFDTIVNKETIKNSLFIDSAMNKAGFVLKE